MKKSLTIGIPVYNAEKYIKHCLKSLFEQTIADKIEFVIVNDCTPDNSMAVVNSVCEKFPQLDIQILNHEKNMGSAATRNTILDNSLGDYIIFVDSDDWADSSYAEKLYNCAIEKKSDIVICSTYRTKFNLIEENELKTKEKPTVRPAKKCPDNKGYISSLLRENKNAAMWCKLIKRSLIEENNLRWATGTDMGEDTIITAKLFYYAKNIQTIEEPLYYHFFNEASLTNASYDKKGPELIKTCAEIESFLKCTGIDFSKDILYLKLRIKRQLLEKLQNRKDYYKLYPETDSIVWNASWIAVHMRAAIYLGLRCPFLAEMIFSLRNVKRIVKQL